MGDTASRVGQILGGGAGGAPLKPVQLTLEEKRAATARILSGGEKPAEPDPVAEALAEVSAPVEDEDLERAQAVEALREAGWSDDETKELSREAATRHALRELRRSQPNQQVQQRAEEVQAPAGLPDILAGLEEELTEELGSKAAKAVAKRLRPLADGLAAVQQQSAGGLADRLIERLGGTYPELRNERVRKAVFADAQGNARQGDTAESAVLRSLTAFYGARRQSAGERAEAQAQVGAQMSAPGEGRGAGKLSKEQVSRAAWKDYRQSGLSKALDTKTRLEARGA